MAVDLKKKKKTNQNTKPVDSDNYAHQISNQHARPKTLPLGKKGLYNLCRFLTVKIA